MYVDNYFVFQGSERFLAIANEEGDLIIQDTNHSGENATVLDFSAHSNAIFDVSWQPQNFGIIATASGDTSVRIWDLENTDFSDTEDNYIRKYNFERSVKCVEFMPQNPNLMVTGTRKGSIFVWDLRDPENTKPALAIRRAHTHSASGGEFHFF